MVAYVAGGMTFAFLFGVVVVGIFHGIHIHSGADRTKAVADVVGVFYLIALNVIVAHNPYVPGGVIAVAVYDGIWFAVPIAALVMCIIDPTMARNFVLSVQLRTKHHSRATSWPPASSSASRSSSAACCTSDGAGHSPRRLHGRRGPVAARRLPFEARLHRGTRCTHPWEDEGPTSPRSDAVHPFKGDATSVLGF
jgi:hypothetical protein